MRPVNRLLVAAASLSLVAVTASADEIRGLLRYADTIFRFDRETGAQTEFKTITGLLDAETVSAIDTGPAGVLYALTDSHLYAVDALSVAAKPVGPRFASEFPFRGTIAFDFHPVTGVARILVGTHPPGAGPDTGTASMSVDPRTGVLVQQDSQTGVSHQLAYAAGDPNEGLGPVVTVAAYHPAVTDTPSFIGVDTARNTLVRIGPAGAAGFTAADDVITTIAPLSGLPAGAAVRSMESMPDGTLLLSAVVEATPYVTTLWAVDVTTGAVTARPEIGVPLVDDISAAPASALGGTLPLVTEKSIVTVDFNRRDKDKLKLVGRIGLPNGGWGGKTVQVDFGGIVREFTMDKRGRGVSGRESFRVSGKPRGGVWKYTLELRGDRFGKHLGIRESDELGVVNPAVDLFVRSKDDLVPAVYRTELTLGYSVRDGVAVARQ